MNRIAKLLIVAMCLVSACPLFGASGYVSASEWEGGYDYYKGYVVKANGLYWCCKDYGDGVMVTGFKVDKYNVPGVYTQTWKDWPQNAEPMGAITIPATFGGKSVVSIGGYAFYDCRGLTSVTIPNSVTSIGEEAFMFCSALKSVTIPSSVTSIGERAFSLCSALKSVTIPSSVTSIGNGAFEGCGALKSVTISEGVTSIGERAFSVCSALKSVTIPSSVTSIGEVAFGGCDTLRSVTIPSSVTSIGWGAFYGCSGLTSVAISEGVTSIGDWAFRGCSAITSVTIPSSVTSIGAAAFVECSRLKRVIVTGKPPSGITDAGIPVGAIVQWPALPEYAAYCNLIKGQFLAQGISVEEVASAKAIRNCVLLSCSLLALGCVGFGFYWRKYKNRKDVGNKHAGEFVSNTDINSNPIKTDSEERLEKLKSMFERHLITESEYLEKRNKIIAEI